MRNAEKGEHRERIGAKKTKGSMTVDTRFRRNAWLKLIPGPVYKKHPDLNIRLRDLKNKIRHTPRQKYLKCYYAIISASKLLISQLIGCAHIILCKLGRKKEEKIV